MNGAIGKEKKKGTLHPLYIMMNTANKKLERAPMKLAAVVLSPAFFLEVVLVGLEAEPDPVLEAVDVMVKVWVSTAVVDSTLTVEVPTSTVK